MALRRRFRLAWLVCLHLLPLFRVLLLQLLSLLGVSLLHLLSLSFRVVIPGGLLVFLFLLLLQVLVFLILSVGYLVLLSLITPVRFRLPGGRRGELVGLNFVRMSH